ncbi:hypothetical protein C7974DRAFT_403336 [Boeremia exigua]|uniref:uncharacterized protein n=1 Tax=Boeremia exigua TaxID=749465 RepID=UPI001E8DC45F|nr:uncharacterized protein C7974DRAFT_403336 [Boeremia exigua]KAH6615124.1 hypothetical protein C7974DRAFT_403336 [Boeremia exigua]
MLCKWLTRRSVAESSEFKYRRLLDLLKTRLAAAADRQIMPRLTEQEEVIFSNLFKEATDALEIEILQEKSRFGSNKTSSRKRLRSGDGSAVSPSKSSMPSTPAPTSNTDETLLLSSGVLNAPGPGIAMGPPPSPAYHEYSTPGVPVTVDMAPEQVARHVPASDFTEPASVNYVNTGDTNGTTMGEDIDFEALMRWSGEG